MKTKIIVIAIILLAVAGGIYYFGRDTKVETPEIPISKIVENEQALVAEINVLRQKMGLIENYLIFQDQKMVEKFNAQLPK